MLFYYFIYLLINFYLCHFWSSIVTVCTCFKQYPLFLLSQLCDEVDALHPSPVGICRRFSDIFTPILQNVLKLAKTVTWKDTTWRLGGCLDQRHCRYVFEHILIRRWHKGLGITCHYHGNINQTLIKCFCTIIYLT